MTPLRPVQQPGRDSVQVESAFCVVREVDARVHCGVIPAQLAPRNSVFAECLSAHEWLPHARILTAATDGLSGPQRVLRQGCG